VGNSWATVESKTLFWVSSGRIYPENAWCSGQLDTKINKVQKVIATCKDKWNEFTRGIFLAIAQEENRIRREELHKELQRTHGENA